MTSARVVTDRLSRWEPLRSQLSSASREAMDSLRGYSQAETPCLSVFAVQPSLLADWREGVAGAFPADWTLREEVLPARSEAGERNGAPEVYCDAVVLVATALHLDSAGAGPFLQWLRSFDLPTFLVLTRFHQMRRTEDVIHRKIEEAARRLDILRLRVFACSAEPGPGLITVPEAAREIRSAIEVGFPEVRPRHVAALCRAWIDRSRVEIRCLRDGLQQRRSHLRAESNVARSTMRGLLVLAGTVGESLRRWSAGFVESVGSLTWGAIRPQVELSTAASDEDWTASLQRTLSAALVERWQALEGNNTFDLEERLEGLIAEARRAFEKNAVALAQEALGFSAGELAGLRHAIADEEPFRSLRERGRAMSQHWRPLTLADIAGVLDEECRGLDLVLADYLGRKLTAEPDDVLPPPAEGSLPGQPWDETSGAPLPAAPRSQPSALRRWVNSNTAGTLRDRVGESTLGSVLAKLDTLITQRVEEQRRLLVEEDLPRALNRYFEACLDAYTALDGELQARLAPLSSVLAEDAA